jgi:dTDP-4-amino-4,6-dideoxy-D-galactose acyltransferase
MIYQMLDWDSRFFGLKVARILDLSMTIEDISNTIEELKEKSVKLVYLPTSRKLDEEKIRLLGGCLVDHKTTYALNLSELTEKKIEYHSSVKPYSRSVDIKRLERLAIQSGRLSRFSVDKNIPKGKYEQLYRVWIQRSICKEIAREVLVVVDKRNDLAGMVTLGEKSGRGDIGLVAVDEGFRGKGYGEILMRAAQCWFLRNGYEQVQVVTQRNNISACNLYKKCGYSVESVSDFFHLWL